MELLPFLAPVATPRATVLLAHGFGEHHGRYRDFIAALGRADYDVWTFDFTGHGQAPGKRAVADVGALIGEHLEARHLLASRARTDKTLLFGHSMGGLITLASTLLSPAHLTATAVTGPALAPLPQLPLAVAKLGARVGRLLPGLKTVSLDSSLLSHDPEIAASYGDDPLVYQGKVPLLTGATMSVQAAATVANAGILSVPVLILHGGEDALASVEGSRDFVARADGLAELRVKDGDYHELLNEVKREAYTQEIIDWYGQW